MNDGFNGDVAPGFSVEDNVNRAVQYQSTHTPAETTVWFYDTVQNNKDHHRPLGESLDYKQIDGAMHGG